MAAALSILHLADSHIGAGLPVRLRRAGPWRGDDLVASYRRVMARAADGRVDLVIHAGDVFNRSQPSDGAVTAAAEPLLAAAVAGAIVVIVPGNHERSRLPACLLLAHPNIHIVCEPRTLTFRLRGLRVAVAAMPCVRRGSAQGFPEALKQTGWSKNRGDVNILAAHQTFESATCGPGNHRFRSGDDVVERGAIPVGFDMVAAGHIHRHQVLRSPRVDGPPIVYAGSTDRISFAEKDEPKGCVIVEWEDGVLRHRFVEHTVRPMAVLPMDVSGLARGRIRDTIADALGTLPADAVAQVRFSGQTSPGAMRGLALADLAREVRPQALITFAARAVEFASARASVRGASSAGVSAFAGVWAPDGMVRRFSTKDPKALPARCGTYALYDDAGRLLYVGKANNVRARVRQHLRGTGTSGFFSGWTRQIRRVEVRFAASSLEALLVEADRIRELRPPFNKQMRLWSRYCYLCGNGAAHGQLAISRDSTSGRRCFGPFPSRAAAEAVLDAVSALCGTPFCPAEDPKRRRFVQPAGTGAAGLCTRYFEGRCGGPCAGRLDQREALDRLRKRDAFLAGTDDAVVAAMSSVAEAEPGRPRGGGEANPIQAGHGDTEWWQIVFSRLALLRDAERLLDGLFVLPGHRADRVLAVLTETGLHIDGVRPSDRDGAERVLDRYRALVGAGARPRPRRLPKEVVDCACTAARHMRRSAGRERFLPASEVRRFDADAFLAAVFSEDASVGQTPAQDASGSAVAFRHRLRPIRFHFRPGRLQCVSGPRHRVRERTAHGH